MKKAAYNILPGTEEILQTMGEQIICDVGR